MLWNRMIYRAKIWLKVRGGKPAFDETRGMLLKVILQHGGISGASKRRNFVLGIFKDKQAQRRFLNEGRSQLLTWAKLSDTRVRVRAETVLRGR